MKFANHIDMGLRIRGVLLLAPLIFFAGCTTVEFVRKDISPRKQAVLRHWPASSPKEEKEYRDKIEAQAREYCQGDYQIEREYQAREETGSTVGIGTGYGVGMGGVILGGGRQGTAMYNFIEVSCKTSPSTQ
ncbi:MAG: hypothetical protein ACK5Y2_11975 [Bdellovibrionales bacterium]